MTKKEYEILIKHTKKNIDRPDMDKETKSLLIDQLERLQKGYKGVKNKKR